MIWPIAPMKATSGQLPRGATWVYEPKWDGHRALVRIADGQVDAASSSGQPRIQRWPWLAAVASCVQGADVVLDGEVVALDDNGRHSFELVGRADRPHAFVVFDVLAAGGRDLRSRPWSERRAMLEAIVEPTPQIFITPVTDDADALMTATRANGFEGIIAKRNDSIYQPGRRATSWVKVKHRCEQEMVVGGYLIGEGSRSESFGSLLVGVYDNGALRFVGAVGTGFNDQALRALRTSLDERESRECPFEPAPKLPRNKARWVDPDLVAQVSFANWTLGGSIRHPVYLGLREDKLASEVVREP